MAGLRTVRKLKKLIFSRFRNYGSGNSRKVCCINIRNWFAAIWTVQSRICRAGQPACWTTVKLPNLIDITSAESGGMDSCRQPLRSLCAAICAPSVVKHWHYIAYSTSQQCVAKTGMYAKKKGSQKSGRKGKASEAGLPSYSDFYAQTSKSAL